MISIKFSALVRWHSSLPALVRLRQEGGKLEASMGWSGLPDEILTGHTEPKSGSKSSLPLHSEGSPSCSSARSGAGANPASVGLNRLLLQHKAHAMVWGLSAWLALSSHGEATCPWAVYCRTSRLLLLGRPRPSSDTSGLLGSASAP